MILRDGPFEACLPEIYRRLGGDGVVLIHSRRQGAFYDYSTAQVEADGQRFVSVVVPEGAPTLPGLSTCYEEMGKKVARFKQPLFVVSGGGRVMDYAKLLAGFAAGLDMRGIQIGEGIFPVCPQLVAVPSTAGSGSEATSFAVLFRDDVKRSVEAPELKPAAVILDPLLMNDQPSEGRAVAGMDALCQVIESIWAKRSDADARGYAIEALELILSSFVNCVNDPNDVDSCASMLRGSYLAGEAINLSRTTGAHAFSYHITRQNGVPHGEAVGMLMEYFIPLNWACLSPDIQKLFCASFNVGGCEEWLECFRDLKKRVGLVRSLDDVGVLSPDRVDSFIESANMERLRNNPRQWTCSDEFKESFLALT